MGTLRERHAGRDSPARIGFAAGLLAALILMPPGLMPAAAERIASTAAPAWPGEAPAPRREILSFDDLDGWADDDHEAALDAFRGSCTALDGPHWPAVCALAHDARPGAARAFFEALFRPVMITDGRAPLLTGYYEPELQGSRRRSARYRHPLYARPEAPAGGAWPTRAQIAAGVLAGRGLEIAWVEDPVEVMFLQIQGSGRVRLAEGGTLRLGYGGSNGHAYRSVGREMVRRGLVEPSQASAAVIRARVSADPAAGRNLLDHNENYVFFRELPDLSEASGPLGAMRRPLTTLRSAAVDPAHVPLGAPVWVEKGGAEPMRRLMVAQDVGSRVKGAQRADLFFGTGDEAGRRAGRVRDAGRVVTLLPIGLAHALAPDPFGEQPSRAPEPLLVAEAEGDVDVSRRTAMPMLASAGPEPASAEPAPRPTAAVSRPRPRPRPSDAAPAEAAPPAVRPRPRPRADEPADPSLMARALIAPEAPPPTGR